MRINIGIMIAWSLLALSSLAAWNGSINRLEEVKQRQQDEALGRLISGWSGRPDEQYRTSGTPSFSIPEFPPFWCFERLILCCSM